MSEYWKSVPRKFCDFCKCWITDNKPSVDFHERGKRHQEAVERRLKEVRKKSYERSLEQDTYDKQMEKIEKAALEAFKKDLAANPKLAKQCGVSLEPKPKPKADSGDGSSTQTDGETEKDDKGNLSEKEWWEAKSPEGYSYYWSNVSGESRWEAPEEYVSIEEQEAEEKKKKEETESEQNAAESAEETEEEETSTKQQKHQTKDPSFTRSAFGAWSVVKEESRPVIFDNSSQAPVPDDIPLPEDIPLPKTEAPKFKERTVSSLGPSSDDSGPTMFKKRKIASGARNVRRRNDDD